MLIQVYKTRCGSCGEELESRTGVLNGKNEIIVDFIDGMEFYCNDCNVATYIEVQSYTV